MPSIISSLAPIELASMRAYASSRKYRARVEQALLIVRQSLEIAPDAYVSFSCGKDSAAMLHLCATIKPDIEARFIRWTESELLDNYAEILAEWMARGYTIRVLDLARATLDERVPERWDLLTEMAPAAGTFIGLRSAESRIRSVALSQYGAIYQRANGWRFCPLATWSDLDVAAYIVAHDLPMLDTYIKHGLSARTSSRVPRHVVRGRALGDLRRRDPARFERLAELYPDAREWV